MLGQATYMKLFDLKDMNKRVFNMDILWCTTAYEEPPFDELFNDYIRLLGNILQKEIQKFLIFILRANYESNFKEVPSIDGYLIHLNSKLKKFIQVAEDNTPVPYAKLIKPGIFYRLCKKRNTHNFLLETFYELLCDLELAYRYFEKSVMLSAMQNV